MASRSNNLTPESSNGSGEADHRPTGSGPRRPLRSATRLVAGIAIAATFAIWVYAFSGAARRDPPDLLDDPGFAVRAEQICTAALADIDEMPDALDAVDGPDRGNQIRNTTVRFESMLDELDRLVGGSNRDIEIAGGWLADWRVLIQDRYNYADAITVDDQAQYLVTDVGAGERMDRRLTRVANTNAMPSCAAPGDVG